MQLFHIPRIIFALIAGLFSANLVAQTNIPDFLRATGGAPEPEAVSWVLLESNTGWVITARNENKRVDPASLTKLMTSYLTFEALANGKLNALDKVYISKKAWNTPGSRMFLEVDTSASIDELIKGLIIQSGNDAAVALAQHIGGSVSGFAKLMNDKAEELGMMNTHYVNSSGLPHPDHYTTALDTAILSRALIQSFPEMYALFSVREYTYNDITQPNRNGLLWRDNGYDGLKTGHTKAAGYCLAGSAVRGNARFVAVVMGAESKKSRVLGVGTLIEYGFSHYETVTVLESHSPVKRLPLFKGEVSQAEIAPLADVSVVVPKGKSQSLNIKYNVPQKLVAPLSTAGAVGQAELSFEGNELGYAQLHPVKNYQQGPIWSQLIDAIKMKLDLNIGFLQ